MHKQQIKREVHSLKKLLVAVCLAVLVAAVLLVASCGQATTTKSGSGTPTQAVTTMLELMKKGDFASGYNMLSAADKKQITSKQWIDENKKQTPDPASANAGVSFKVTSEKVTGDKAVVVVKMSEGSQSQNVSFATVKEGSKWLVGLEASGQLNQQQ